MKQWTIFWWVPLFKGCLIYVLFRTDTLIYNRILGNIFYPLTYPDNFLEKVIVLSVPGGLWAMSYSLLIFHIRKDKKLKNAPVGVRTQHKKASETLQPERVPCAKMATVSIHLIRGRISLPLNIAFKKK